MNEELKGLFTPGPTVSFRCLRKLSPYLVRTKLCPLKISVSMIKCNRVQYVKMLNETDTFTNTLTGKQTLSLAMLTNPWSISLLVTNATNKQHEDQEVPNCRKHTLGEICISRSVHLFGHFYYSDLVVTVINF